MAIINGKLFDDVAYNIFEKSAHFKKDWIRDNWAFNRFNKFEEQKISNDCDEIQQELICLKNENARMRLFNQYTSYLARGWLRPDYMPEMFLSDWVCLSIAESWRKKLSRKVSIAVYSNWKFFKFYHIDHLTMLKSKMGLGVKIDE
ncbi:hypothetical protein OCF84_17270 [Shewanella xiamenensis]|uniref:hypothetical protein n=1 Tax=Shewanella xiamenensis TaxID=332186 RepID=UPI0024AE1088|nr:hypothetical protein [Shewanella xiamenensis]WHF55124.1 hypothetical protein OCF84_17270 [Shewanella xiamenensis]